MTLGFELTLLLLGFVGAMISGLVGVGGAIVMIPLLYYVPPLLGLDSLDIRHVTGVTMAQVFTAAVVGAWTHGRRAMVHRPLAVAGGSSMALGSLIGALGSRYISSRALLAVFAAMATIALPLMFRRPAEASRPDAAVAHARVRRVAAVAWPGVIGLASGLVGAGGAFLLVPVLIAVLGVPVRLSIGTSLAMTSASAAMGFLGKVLTAQVPMGPALAVVAGSLLGAAAGARLSHRAPIAFLRLLLATLIAIVAVRVWVDVLTR